MQRPTSTFVLLTLFAALALPAMARADFPPGFLWGTAVSGFQTEAGGVPANGDPASDWWVWTRDPANVANGVVSGDLPENGPGFYDRYASDLRLARKRLRNNAFRLGIEWSRIFPTSTAGVDTSGGIGLTELQALDALANQTAVAHYRAVFAEIRSQGLTPFVTLVHFTLPLWIHDPIATRDALAGSDPNAAPPVGGDPAGWIDAAIVPEFAKYAAYCAWKFGDQIDFWAPINEPFVVAVSGYANVPGLIGGNFPPGAFSFSGALLTILNEVAGQAAAYDAVKAWDTADADGDGADASVGMVHNMVAFAPQRPNKPEDVLSAQHADYIYNRIWLNATIQGDVDANVDGVIGAGEHHPEYVGKGDFVGVNYYFRGKTTAVGQVTPLLPLFDFVPKLSFTGPTCSSVCSDLGWESYPQGFRDMLGIASGYGLPIYVTENGIADADDDLRPGYLVNHLEVVEQAIADGIDVRGYFAWSLVDNFEWALGLAPKFGFFKYDPVKLRRTMRRSGQTYARIIKKNTVPQQLRDRY